MTRCVTTRLLAFTLVSVLAVPSTTMAASDTLKAAIGCRKKITTQGRNYTNKRLALLLGCADKLLKCEILLEVDGDNPNSCRSRAKDTCKRRIGPAADSGLNRAADAFDTKAGEACLAFGIAPMLSNAGGGLWFSNDATCGTAVDIPSLLDCLRGELEDEVDAMVGNTLPRAGLLLDNSGLGGDFPNIPRPPIVPVVINAVVAGDMANPGLISINAGEAIRFTADPLLSCGMGQNGKVTIFISPALDPCTDPTAQQQQIKEPYGAGVSATLGPFIADQNYCITLKDGPCDDQETGVVDVP